MYKYKRGAVKSIFLVILVFSIIYYLAMDHFDNINNLVDAIYFSATVSSTVGLGDIAPTSNIGKIIVTANIIFTVGVIYILIFE